MVISLSGRVPEGFKFRIPGADHHARWMSKGIYYIKIWLLSRIFVLSVVERDQVQRIFRFTVVIYAKAWFLAPLSSSAPRNDLEFHYKVLLYRQVEPKAAFMVLQSIRRHQWYTCPQMATLALADKHMESEEREMLAKTLHRMPRNKITTGRPEFPFLNWEGEVLARPKLQSLVTSNSWLVFQLLGLTSNQDWLLTPCSMWDLFADYQKVEEFARNISVTNDLAERVNISSSLRLLISIFLFPGLPPHWGIHQQS